MTIYTVYTEQEADKRKDELDLYEKAHQTYVDRDFATAESLFRELAETGAEAVLYDLYIERCVHLKDEPPDCHWDCVFTHKTK